MTLPVFIAGAGPVGLTMACELARYGVPLRIVDKAPARTDKSKALVLWSRSLELLDRGGSVAPFLEAGLVAGAVHIFAGGRELGHVDMSGVNSPFGHALMLPQSETERLLEERLRSFGVQVERGTELISFEDRGDEVELTIRRADGGRESLATAWLLGCDGAHSLVRHGLGLPFVGETLGSDWVLADIHLAQYPCASNDTAIFWHRDGILVVFPIGGGRFRLIADMPPSGLDLPPSPTLQTIRDLIARRGPAGMGASDPVWLSGFRINGRKVGKYRQGRVFVSGDAAHVHSPAGGQGMNTGMQDAFNLAWKLAMAINGSCREAILDSYSPERSGVGDQVLKSAGRLTAVATLKNPVAQTLRNIAGHVALGLAPVRHSIAEGMSEIGIAYTDSPLNGPATARVGPTPGERVAPVAGEVPVGAGRAPRFALFARETDEVVGLAEQFPALLDPTIRPPLGQEGLWLVRPDGYLACSAGGAAGIAEYLAGLALVGAPA